MEVSMRLRIPALVAALAGLLSSPVTAQSPGTLEIGGYGRFTRFDASLGFGEGFGAGGLLGVMRPAGRDRRTVAYVSTSAPGSATVTLTPIHLRLLVARWWLIRRRARGAACPNQCVKPPRVEWCQRLSRRAVRSGRQAGGPLRRGRRLLPSPLNERPGNPATGT
jgi:hypothetical protein